MRSPSSFSAMRCFLRPLAQAMAERDALVEHEALAAPAAFGFRDLLQISEDAALEVIDLGKTPREQQRARLLAADAAGAEHRDPCVLRRIELGRDKIPEVPEARDIRVERALKGAERHLEGVAGVDDK